MKIEPIALKCTDSTSSSMTDLILGLFKSISHLLVVNALTGSKLCFKKWQMDLSLFSKIKSKISINLQLSNQNVIIMKTMSALVDGAKYMTKEKPEIGKILKN